MDRDIVAAMVLGDGYLEQHGKGVRLQIKHSQRAKAYVEWKRKKLKDLAPSAIYHGYGKYPFYRFVTKTHPYLEELREKLYREGTKTIPQDIKGIIKTSLELAIYFMDDGTIDKRRGSILFETQSFSNLQIRRLAKCLRENFDLKSTIHNSGNRARCITMHEV